MNSRLLPIGLISLFLLFRLFPLFFGIESLYNGEELNRGVIAQELIDGLKFPLIDYRPDDYHGGSLVVGVMAVPLFLLLGPNLIALKLVALAFSLASFILVYHFCRKYFGLRTALMACGLWILCPPGVSQTALFTFGTHSESVLLTFSALLLLYRLLFEQKGGLFHYAVLGLICGFGFWFTHVVLVTLLNCLLCLILFKPTFFKEKGFPAFLGGMLVGLSPWIYFNMTRSLEGLIIFRQALGINSDLSYSIRPLPHILVKTARLFIEILPASLRFEDLFGIHGRLLGYLYYGLGVLSFGWFFCLEKNTFLKKGKETPLVLFILLFVLFYACTSFRMSTSAVMNIGYRYLAPLYPFLFILLARALDGLWQRGRWLRCACAFACCLLLTLGFLGNLQLAAWPLEFGRGFSYKGFSYSQMQLHNALKGDPRPDPYFSLADKFPEEARHYLYRSFWWPILRSDEEVAAASARIQKRDPRYHHLLYQSLGTSVGYGFPDSIGSWARLEKSIPPPRRGSFYRGLSRAGPTQSLFEKIGKGDIQSHLDLIQKINPPYRHYFFRRLGLYSASYLKDGRAFRVLAKIPPKMQAFVYRGVGARLVSDADLGQEPFRAGLHSVHRKHHPSLYEGAGEGIYDFFGEDLNLSSYLLQRLEPAWRGRGLLAFERARKEAQDWR